ncbi:glycerophosphodiester phosphodiesterase [Flavobacterium gilvum]|uniref:Glycerophosphodiester phosphodiesterase n=1 Tax=Flavobacterium gilvum TaxID=1492737 RepID=A0AAC9N4K4_9FLAO|nr:glycerophosphodiester phosphodiesterase family protein [Flavobacterium gilvum]AOW08411.1 glycerophosphodiester phosphodiesterase [Flavobacterium gilvum]KFC58337.1 glycerophosphoryl diester phosphodiesterase [Flavobacterium gilvum]
MKKILKIGHRGANGYKPENTLVSFEKAIAMGADGIELDVHLSLEGHLIVIHDETIDRTTNGKGVVNQLTLQELKSFRIDDKYEIPTLGEVLDLVNKRCFVNIELKNQDTAEKVVELIEHYISEKKWNKEHFIVSSFDWNALQQVRFLNENIRIGVLTETDLDLAISFARFMKAEALHPDFQLLTDEYTSKIQEKGILVFPWTVNKAEDIQRIKLFNVDGIITDFLDRV